MKVRFSRITAAILAVIFLIGVPYTLNKIFNSGQKKKEVYIRLHLEDNQVKTFPLEEYLLGVVAAEMPAEFETEALKAQAVAARTYVLKRKTDKTISGNIYDIDTTEMTQTWISNQDMLKKWGLVGYWKYRKKIADALEQTEGMYLTYKGQIIDAVYHSSSGRKNTEAASDVWSSHEDYLVSVSSGETNTRRFVKQLTFDPDTFYKLLGLTAVPQPFSEGDLLIIARTKAGRIKNIAFRNKVFPATEFRFRLGLPATDFEWRIDKDRIEFCVYGNGHAVGMSQYGANDLAKEGRNFKEILAHYYPGTVIQNLD